MCEYVFGGNLFAFSRRARVNRGVLTRSLCGIIAPRPLLLSQIIKSGVVNAEWLMCGTGPMFREDPDASNTPGQLSKQINSRHCVFDTTSVHVQPLQRLRRAHKPARQGAIDPIVAENLRYTAQLVHLARVHDKPVILYLNCEAIENGAGPLAIEFFKKGYITGVALSIEASVADFDLATIGKLTDGRSAQTLIALNNAVYRAAEEGVGYGEAVGRWGLANATNRNNSVLAAGFDLEMPVTAHGGLGGTLCHFYPARRGAEFGAALGAALYVDMLLLTEQLCAFAGDPDGVFIQTDRALDLLVYNACQIAKKPRVALYNTICGPYCRTVPALLAMCDAVYSGDASNG